MTSNTWIDVREQLPEMQDGQTPSKDVLVLLEDGRMCAAYFDDTTWLVDCPVMTLGEFLTSRPLNGVTHWMPLPPAPKVE